MLLFMSFQCQLACLRYGNYATSVLQPANRQHLAHCLAVSYEDSQLPPAFTQQMAGDDRQTLLASLWRSQRHLDGFEKVRTPDRFGQVGVDSEVPAPLGIATHPR